MGRMTLRRLAAQAGVSLATASRVMNGDPLVAADTRKRVLDAAVAAGYVGRRNPAGSPRVAILFSSLDDHFWSRMASKLSQALDARGFQYELVPIRHQGLLALRSINGALLLDDPWERPPEWSVDLPVVTVGGQEDARHGLYGVIADNEGGIDHAVRHLHALGHRRIAMIVHGLGVTVDRHRVDHFRKAVARRRGLTGEVAVAGMLLSRLGELRLQGVTGLLLPSYNDALAAYHALALLNWKIPDEVSVVVRGDDRITPYLLPRPTEIRFDINQIALDAVDLLVRLMAGKPAAKAKQVPYELVAGRSTAKPPPPVENQRG